MSCSYGVPTFRTAYLGAQHDEEVARRVLALRAMVTTGLRQREKAAALGISQPAVSQQLRAASDLRLFIRKG